MSSGDSQTLTLEFPAIPESSSAPRTPHSTSSRHGHKCSASSIVETSSSAKGKHRMHTDPHRRGWPVPQIIVDFLGNKSAWGRETLTSLGYVRALQIFAETFCPRATRTENQPILEQWFISHSKLSGTFQTTHGFGDEGRVILQPVGWDEVMSNVAMITLELTEDMPE